jgi:hypothetical protein
MRTAKVYSLNLPGAPVLASETWETTNSTAHMQRRGDELQRTPIDKGASKDLQQSVQN